MQRAILLSSSRIINVERCGKLLFIIHGRASGYCGSEGWQSVGLKKYDHRFYLLPNNEPKKKELVITSKYKRRYRKVHGEPCFLSGPRIMLSKLEQGPEVFASIEPLVGYIPC